MGLILIRFRLNNGFEIPGRSTVYFERETVRETADRISNEGLRLSFMESIDYRSLADMPTNEEARTIRQLVSNDITIDFDIPVSQS